MGMMESKRSQYLQYAVAVLLLMLAIARTSGPEWQCRMDATFFMVIGAAALLLLIPLSGLKQIKAGTLELTVDQPEVSAAIGSLNLGQVQDAKLRTRLQNAQDILPSVRGSRVLWIDDHPEKVSVLRRLFRSLGIDVVSALSSQGAKDLLLVNADYDLIISDVQREGESHLVTGGIGIHEGTNFVVWLRTYYSDPMVREIRVVFYAAYDWERLVEFTRPARETQPEPCISNSVPDFVDKVIQQLREARSTPLTVGGSKEPTDP